MGWGPVTMGGQKKWTTPGGQNIPTPLGGGANVFDPISAVGQKHFDPPPP